MTDDQIKHMVNRFLSWRLPENFQPDGGISFKAVFNENTAHPMHAEPTGTNLFDARQAEEMIRHMLEGLSTSAEYTATLAAMLAEADALLADAMVQLAEGRINTRRNRANLIAAFRERLRATSGA